MAKVVDKEFLAIKTIERALASLSREAKQRILVFVAERQRAREQAETLKQAETLMQEQANVN